MPPGAKPTMMRTGRVAMVVPSTVDPSLIFTVALGSAVPVSASSAVMCLPLLVSSASAILTFGAVLR